MTILCATDFSPSAKQAANVAVAIAAKLGEPLHLVHSINELAVEKVLASGAEEVYAALGRWLEEENQRLLGRGAAVTAELLAGIPDARIAQAAASRRDRMIVLGHLGQRQPADILLGSVAERLCQVTTRPVLVVRAVAAFDGWLVGARKLRVLVAMDFTDTARAALAWLSELRRLGELDIVLGHVAAHANRPLEELETKLRDELRSLPGDTIDHGDIEMLVEPSQGRIGERLVDAAARENIDLVVVGSHQRRGLARLWHTSVSKDVVLLAPMSVALVPAATTGGA